jgi:uncharacterized protein (TIGR02453 family)
VAFNGWSAEALEFYEGLEADNSKTYWTTHKAVYDQKVLAPTRELMDELAAEFGEPRIFRPYRDLRFSSDKTPYKTNVGGMLGRTCYVSLSADGLAAGDGLYQMDQAQLARYRTAVSSDDTGDTLAEIIAELAAGGIEVRGTGTLKTTPRGYPADHPRIDLLRHKGLYAWRHWPAEQWLETARAKEQLLSFYRTTRGFSSWLTKHVTGLS